MPENTSDIQDEDFNGARQGCVSFLDNTLKMLELDSVNKITRPHLLKKMKKDEMAEFLWDALGCLDDLVDCTTDFRSATTSVKCQLIESQQTVIKLQSELLATKDEQLNSLKVTVKESVEDTMKAGFISYSSVVQNNHAQSRAINPEALKTVVQNVVQDEDRSKNVMIFGLPEVPDEELNSTIRELFQAIGEKPRVEACRLGRSKSDKTVQPIKATFASSTVVDHILSKTKKLKQVEKFKSVYVSPDRSLEQRIKQRELIKDLRSRSIADPDNKYFIKGGTICSVAKSRT